MTKPTPTQNLMTMLNLTPTEPVGGDEAFSAVTLTRESPRTYGGQVLAQAIMAADSTVTDCLCDRIIPRTRQWPRAHGCYDAAGSRP